MSPQDAAVELGRMMSPWWVAGGWAVDLLVGRQTRPHGDLDIVVLRRDQAIVRQHLESWDLWAADPPGVLRPWSIGETLPSGVHDVWCRRHPDASWAFQLMIDDTDGDDWLFRRDHRIRRPIVSLAGRASTADLPVLAPEVQLLHKSRDPRPKDHADLLVVRGTLTDRERHWLRTALTVVAPDHPWIAQL